MNNSDCTGPTSKSATYGRSPIWTAFAIASVLIAAANIYLRVQPLFEAPADPINVTACIDHFQDIQQPVDAAEMARRSINSQTDTDAPDCR